jgi:uncharacterized protein (DUF1778 family)
MEEPKLKMGPPIILSAEAYDWLVKYLEEPPRDLPKLRALFEKERRFERGEDSQDPGTSQI